MESIYPKNIARSRVVFEINTCFVLMPFKAEYDALYAEIRSALAEIGFKCYRADDLFDNRPIVTTCVKRILSSHFIIADLTGRNANVFYETGIAHAFRDVQNVILISQTMEDVPFDLRHFPVISYDRQALAPLRVKLRETIEHNKQSVAGKIVLGAKLSALALPDEAIDRIVEMLEQEDGITWSLIATLGDGPIDEHIRMGASHHIWRFRKRISDLWTRLNGKEAEALVSVYIGLVSRHSEEEDVQRYAVQCMAAETIEGFPLSAEDQKRRLVELIISLAGTESLRIKALEWLINYLRNPKVAGINIARNLVEQFVFEQASDPLVRDLILEAVQSSDDRLREAAVDMVGATRLPEGDKVIVRMLPSETNPYIARSSFVALGKLRSASAPAAILGWLEKHQAMLSSGLHDFLIEHAREALETVGSPDDLDRLRKLASAYSISA